MPIYTYINPTTGKHFEEIATMENSDKPFILTDGTECPRVKFPPTKRGCAIIDKNREVFEADPDFCKKMKPKYVRFQDGHRERYDPTKHC